MSRHGGLWKQTWWTMEADIVDFARGLVGKSSCTSRQNRHHRVEMLCLVAACHAILNKNVKRQYSVWQNGASQLHTSFVVSPNGSPSNVTGHLRWITVDGRDQTVLKLQHKSSMAQQCNKHVPHLDRDLAGGNSTKRMSGKCSLDQKSHRKTYIMLCGRVIACSQKQKIIPPWHKTAVTAQSSQYIYLIPQRPSMLMMLQDPHHYISHLPHHYCMIHGPPMQGDMHISLQSSTLAGLSASKLSQ